MKLEVQTCPLEHAKTLKEFGLTDMPCRFFHAINMKHDEVVYIRELVQKGKDVYVERPHESYLCDELYAAFTTGELGAMLPIKIKNADLNFRYDAIGNYHVQYLVDNEEGPENVLIHKGNQVWFSSSSSEADARAIMLIYLLKNKLTTVEDINRRLAR